MFKPSATIAKEALTFYEICLLGSPLVNTLYT